MVKKKNAYAKGPKFPPLYLFLPCGYSWTFANDVCMLGFDWESSKSEKSDPEHQIQVEAENHRTS